MTRQKLKPYGIAVLLIVLYAVELFLLAPILQRYIGMWASFGVEVLLAVTAVVVFVCFRGKLKVIFPFKKPKLAKFAGTFVLWLGTLLLAMLVTMVIAYFFPQQIYGASESTGAAMAGLPIGLSLFLMALTPAICEEMAFRGALFSCFRSAPSRWIGLVAVSVIFAAFHGSVWRMLTITILGLGLGYVLMETENMFYNMFFHFINNAVPVLLIGIMGGIYKNTGTSDMWSAASDQLQSTGLPLGTLGAYLMYGSAIPFLLYIGNYLLHKGQPGYDRGLFPREKKKTLLIMVCIGMGILFVGFLLFMISSVGVLRGIFGGLHGMS